MSMSRRMNGPTSLHRRGVQRAPARSVLPPGIPVIAVLCLLLAVLGSNTMLGLGAAVLLLIGSALLYRPGESPVLLFIFGYQWLQVSAVIYHANWLGMSIDEYSIFTGLDMETAAALSLLGLLLLALGMRSGAGPYKPGDAERTRSMASHYPTRRWFLLYIAAWLGATVVQSATWVIPGLSQPLLALANLKWAFFLILTYAVFASPRGQKLYWLAAFGLELVMSLGGFFSDFKTVFFFSIFGIVAAQVKIAPRTYAAMGALMAVLMVFAVAWTEIKPVYRDFVSGGTGQQVVTVDFNARIGKLSELVAGLDGEAMSDGLNKLVRRMGYLDFFAATLSYVPRVMPHEGGAIWADAIVRPFMPRMFFPEKTEIDDSERTNKYTGTGVAGADTGTSISIGYMGETYIDFGSYGMMAVLLAFGYVLGRIYRYFATSIKSRGILGLGMSSAVLQVMVPFESSITKTVGGVIVAMIVAWLLITFVIPNVARWVQADRHAR